MGSPSLEGVTKSSQIFHFSDCRMWAGSPLVGRIRGLREGGGLIGWLRVIKIGISKGSSFLQNLGYKNSVIYFGSLSPRLADLWESPPSVAENVVQRTEGFPPSSDYVPRFVAIQFQIFEGMVHENWGLSHIQSPQLEFNRAAPIFGAPILDPNFFLLCAHNEKQHLVWAISIKKI